MTKKKEEFEIGDIVRHKVSLETGIIDTINYERIDDFPISYDISIEFERVIKDVHPWLLEKYVPSSPPSPSIQVL